MSFMMGGRIHTPWRRMAHILLPIEEKKVKEEAKHEHTSHLGIVRQGFGQRELESMRSTNDVESKQGWRIENVYKLKIH
jgi:hypothetical protein